MRRFRGNGRALLRIIGATVVHHSPWYVARIAQVVDHKLLFFLGYDVRRAFGALGGKPLSNVLNVDGTAIGLPKQRETSGETIAVFVRSTATVAVAPVQSVVATGRDHVITSSIVPWIVQKPGKSAWRNMKVSEQHLGLDWRKLRMPGW